MNRITTPMMADQMVMDDMTEEVGTHPSLAEATDYDVAAVQSGTATKYWDECLPYPSSNKSRLWLYRNGWKRLDNPGSSLKDMVQRAFLGTNSNVRIWYSGSKIVGLVVEGA